MRRLVLALAALVVASCETVPALPEFRDRTPSDIAGFFDCLREKSLTVIAAHRGGDAPAENAIETFDRTARGAPGPVLLEIDVRRTSDGELVLLHDETLDRTTTGKGPVAGVSAATFRALQLKDESGAVLASHPPTLKRALDWSRNKAILELDVKHGAPFADVIAAVRLAKAENRVVVIVYSTEDAVTMQRLAPDLMVSVPAESIAALQAISSVRVNTARLLGWTGTTEPNSALNIELAGKGVEVLFGTLGNAATSWDARFARDGDVGYTAFADTGINVIATDRPLEAMRAIDDADGPGAPAAACLTAKVTR